jgi:hypothetical protein
MTHVNNDNPTFSLFRKLYRWCLDPAEGKVQPICCNMVRSKGPYWTRTIDLTAEEHVREGSLSLTVTCDLRSACMCIEMTYLSEGHEQHNPMILVGPEGDVYRTHGDFHRVRAWVEALDVSDDGLTNEEERERKWPLLRSLFEHKPQV